MRSDSHPATWHWLYQETIRRLDSLQRRVNEGKDLDSAIEFAGYLLWSKLPDILSTHDCEGALKVDSSLLRWKAENLQRSVWEAYRCNKGARPGEQGQLDNINHKLDLIAGQLVKLSSANEDGIPTPALRVVDGGAQ